MKRRFILPSALVLLGLWLAQGCTSEKVPNLKDLEAAIHRELPLGTPRSRVIGFLQERAILYHDSKDIAYFKGPRTIWGLLSRTKGLLLVVDTVLTT